MTTSLVYHPSVCRITRVLKQVKATNAQLKMLACRLKFAPEGTIFHKLTVVTTTIPGLTFTSLHGFVNADRPATAYDRVTLKALRYLGFVIDIAQEPADSAAVSVALPAVIDLAALAASQFDRQTIRTGQASPKPVPVWRQPFDPLACIQECASSSA